MSAPRINNLDSDMGIGKIFYQRQRRDVLWKIMRTVATRMAKPFKRTVNIYIEYDGHFTC